MNVNEKFQWERHPKAEQLIDSILEESCRQNSFIQTFKEQLRTQTSTRLFDWLDHVIIGSSPEKEKELEETGFVSEKATPSYRVFHHPSAQLPRVVVKDDDQSVVGIAVKVESIGDFLSVRGISGDVEGYPLSGYRRCCVSTDNDVSLWVVERRGNLTMEPTHNDSDYVTQYLQQREKWKSRPRQLDDEEEAFHSALLLAEEIVETMGQDVAAWLIFECEREYWQVRNTAGQIQKNRQDTLGMGWANHDHHTFRSSRRYFPTLVRLFEILGFHCRERFYAGEEAGWGAQVMENSRCGLILFLDVDLDPHELEIDFSHQPIPELDKLGTIGLWCELHGDSALQAGMHHLEAQFFHEQLTEDLAKVGIGMMQRFSDFPYLKQAFTSGEVWTVDPKRVEKLLQNGKITGDQAKKFLKYGAVGSHMENLQRREGYKGFNQKNVSFIIKKTDPREIEASR